MDLTAPSETPVDVAFALKGEMLPRDHAFVLAQALTERLPWLARESFAGIHPVKIVPGYRPIGLLSQRVRLRVRVPVERVTTLASLSGCVLHLAGNELRVGEHRTRALLPHSTLFSALVASETVDELEFMRSIEDRLRSLQIDAHCVCGRRGQVRTAQGLVEGFSLMLHGLSAPHSLRAQGAGLGPHRLLGCGIFVPHRSAAAVGA